MSSAITHDELSLYEAARKHYPLLTAGDAEQCVGIAHQIAGTGALDLMLEDGALYAACEAVESYRRRKAVPAAIEAANALPVRPAVNAETAPGGGRFYWRVEFANGDKEAVVRGADAGHRGTLCIARKMAREAILAGRQPVALLPPDYDPKTTDEWTVNTAKPQPAGQTVRQRTKRH